MKERVQKIISEAGVASRRKAEEFIKSGQVFINGKKAKLGDKADPALDIVKVYGKIIKPAERKIYLALNKPQNYVVSKRDPQNRKTVFELLPANLRNKVWNIGRLDYETEGLLILTNDGELTQQLAHPSFEHEKEYEATTQESPTKEQLDMLREGVEIATGLTAPAKVSLIKRQPASLNQKNSRPSSPKILIAIHEGKKHQIRRMLDNVGLSVKNLKRVRINKLTLPTSLSVGQFMEVKKEDIL